MSPSPAPILSVLWMQSLVVEAVLVVLVWKMRRSWPSFLIYLGAHFVWNAALYPLAHMHRPALYFWSYWIVRAALYGLECAAAALALRRVLDPIRYLPKSVLVAAAVFCSAACGAGWFLANTIENQRALPITRIVLGAERGLTTMEAITILFLVGFASKLAFRWGRTELFVVAGFISQALATMASDALFLLVDKSHLLPVRVGLQIADIATLILWIIAFIPVPQPNFPLRPEAENEGVLFDAVSDCRRSA